MKNNPLRILESLGQSVWLDYLARGALDSGQLRQWIELDGVSGVTSNPSIFEKAIVGSHDYDGAIHDLALDGRSAEEIYQRVTVEDIKRAADLLCDTYQRTEGRDGYVSLEVSPRLAHDTAGTVAEARRLWAAVSRPNLFIKVPGTLEGLPAIQQLISERININVTLLFGLPRYRQVAEAYLLGLESLAARGGRLSSVASVASFFLSRIDVRIDPLLEKLSEAGGASVEVPRKLHGELAVASAKLAGRIHHEIFTSPRLDKLAALGARPQRLLWASTSTKNPSYPDLKYVEPLIGSDTINTLPLETLNAYRDHGKPALRLGDGVAEAQIALNDLAGLGIDLDGITQQLEDQGVAAFAKAFEVLMESLESARASALNRRLAA